MVPIKYIVGIILQSLPLFLINLALVLIGFIAVPIGLLFRYEDKSHKGDPSYPKWKMVKMPRLFHIWNNYEEGCIAKGEYLYLVGEDPASFKNMFIWLCLRNPANNLRTFKMFSCDAIMCDHKIYEGAFWFFVLSVHKTTGKKYYSFRYRKTHKNPENGDLVVHLGFKMFPEIVKMARGGVISKENTLLRYRSFAVQFILMRRSV